MHSAFGVRDVLGSPYECHFTVLCCFTCKLFSEIITKGVFPDEKHPDVLFFFIEHILYRAYLYI